MAASIIHSDKLESTLVQGSFTLSSFAVPAGTDKRLVVVVLTARGAGNTPARTISSVTWNGNNLTSQAQAVAATGTGARVAIFDLALGTTTATSNIVVTLSASGQGCIIHAFVVEDVEQGTPSPTAVSSNNLSDAITLSAAGIAIDGLLNNSNNTASDFSLTAATQTQTGLSPSRTFAGLANEQNLGTSSVVGSGSQTFGWTATNSSNRAHVIVGYLQASGGSTTIDVTAATYPFAGASIGVNAETSISVTAATFPFVGASVAVIRDLLVNVTAAAWAWVGASVPVRTGAGGIVSNIRLQLAIRLGL